MFKTNLTETGNCFFNYRHLFEVFREGGQGGLVINRKLIRNNKFLHQ